MAKSVDMTKVAASLFVVVFVVNVLPAFAPPTWTTMSFIGLTIPNVNVVLLAVVAATAATSGRIVLANLSRDSCGERLLSEQSSTTSMQSKLELRVGQQ